QHDVNPSPRDERDREAIPLLLVAAVSELSVDTLRLRLTDTGAEVEVTNALKLPVHYRGKIYRITNLEVGDEVRLHYFRTTQEAGVPSSISQPVKIEVLRSVSEIRS